MLTDDIDVNSSISAEIAQVDKLSIAQDNRNTILDKIKRESKIYKPPPGKIKVPTIKDFITHTRTSDRSTIRYFTTGRKFEKPRDIFSEPCLFSISHESYLKDMAFKPIKQPKLRPNHYYMKGLNNDIFARIHIPEVANVPLCKLDYDPEYFSLIRSRPIKVNFDKRKFAENSRKDFFKRLTAGFIEDEIKLHQEHHIRDLWHLNNIQEELEKTMLAFERFIYELQEESVELIKESQEITVLKDNKLEELNVSSEGVNTIKNSIYRLYDSITYRKNCKESFYKISPVQWQEEFDRDYGQYFPIAKQLSEKVGSLYNEFKRLAPVQDESFDDVLTDILDIIEKLGPPKIYFTYPWEVDYIFKQFELENIQEAQHLTDVEKIEKKLEKLYSNVKEYYVKEFACITEEMNSLQEGILYEKQRCAELEKIAKDLIQTVYKDAVSGDHILETYALVQNMYEEIVGDFETKLSYIDMIKLIEQTMVDVWQQVRAIDTAKYQEYEEIVVAQMEKDYESACAARRREKEMVLMLNRLEMSFLPPYKHMWKKPKPRSMPIHEDLGDNGSSYWDKKKGKKLGSKCQATVRYEQPFRKFETEGASLIAKPSESLKTVSDLSLIENFNAERLESETSDLDEDIPEIEKIDYDYYGLYELYDDLVSHFSDYELPVTDEEDKESEIEEIDEDVKHVTDGLSAISGDLQIPQIKFKRGNMYTSTDNISESFDLSDAETFSEQTLKSLKTVRKEYSQSFIIE